jgi:hypothetical protein
MTSGSDKRLENTPGRPRRLLGLLIGLLLTVVTTAVGAPAAAAENGVGPHHPNSIFTVGPQATTAPNRAGVHALPLRQTASATGVAAETAGNAGDHIVLGLKNQGLEQTAVKVGGRTLLKDSDWQNTLRTAVADPSSNFTVSLDGMSGSSTYSQVMGAAQRGASGAGGYTDWEMAQLYGGGRLPGVTFVRGGSVVDNPFG